MFNNEIDEDSVRQLQKQTRGEFSCVLENIGTDDRCIIEKSDAQLLEKIIHRWEALRCIEIL